MARWRHVWNESIGSGYQIGVSAVTARLRQTSLKETRTLRCAACRVRTSDSEPVAHLGVAADRLGGGGMPTDRVRLTIWVRGYVQGVGFRWWVRERASALGLAGSAGNLDDGSVEIVVEGARADCADLLARVQGSSTPGRVRSATSRWGAHTGVTGFTLS